MSDLKYKMSNELRDEILTAVGVETYDRYEDGSQRGIRKGNLLFVVAELQPEGERYNFSEMNTTTIYSLLADWVGVEAGVSGGNNWTMNRELLKAIHNEIHDN